MSTDPGTALGCEFIMMFKRWVAAWLYISIMCRLYQIDLGILLIGFKADWRNICFMKSFCSRWSFIAFCFSVKHLKLLIFFSSTSKRIIIENTEAPSLGPSHMTLLVCRKQLNLKKLLLMWSWSDINEPQLTSVICNCRLHHLIGWKHNIMSSSLSSNETQIHIRSKGVRGHR